MSFFFSKHKAKPKPEPTGPRNKVTANKLRQNAPMLNRLGCRACPLKDIGNLVEASIPKKGAEVYFLGEAPGENEEREGRPFIGKSGRLLRGEIPEEYANRCAFGNVLRHRPPDNRTPEWNEVECCRSYTIAAIEKARPKLIVGLGLIALQWVLGTSDMKGQRGRVFAVQVGDHKCYFLPTYHPSFILRTSFNDDKPFQSRFGHAFRLDVLRAFKVIEALEPPVVISPAEAKTGIDMFYPGGFLGFESLIEYFDRARKSGKIAIDLETYPLRPYSQDASLVSASISFYETTRGNGKTLRTFVFPVHHPKAEWSTTQLTAIKDSWMELLTDKKVLKIAHNTPFEVEWLMHEMGTEIIDHHGWGDTMMQAHVIDKRKGDAREADRRPTYQSLDFLCRQYFGLKLKSLFKLQKKDMRKIDIDEILLYNGCDSKHTLMLHDAQDKILALEELTDVYGPSRPRQTTVAIMQRLGIEVDQEVAKGLAGKLQREIDTLAAEIQEMPVIKQYVQDKKEFNPYSQHHVLDVFQNYLKADVKVPKKHSKTEFRFTVDKNMLGSIDHPLAPAIIRLRNRAKLKSTYIDEFILGTGSVIYPDGKLHTSFNTTFTTSARLSSDEPNLQNFPKHQDKWVRKQIKPKAGFILVSVDYGQLEWCTACIECNNNVMVDATWTGYDVHMAWAEKIADRWPDLIGGKQYRDNPAIMKKARSRVKNKAVFPLIFGAQDTSVAGYLNMPDDVAKDIFSEFWETFEGLGDWQKRLMSKYYESGYVQNKLGRRRHYPLSKNEAINYPIQSLGAEIVIDAMDRLSQIACETGEWHLHPHLNIHDDLTFVIEDNDSILDESIDFITKEMLLLPYDFINVPMGVKVSIGYDWDDMQDIMKVNTIDIGRHKARK